MQATTPRIGFVAGLRYPLRGARLVYFEHRGLARFWLPPILITGIALASTTAAALHYRSELVELVWATPSGEGLVVLLMRWLHEFLEWLVAALLIVLGVVVAALVSSVVAAPFNDALSEAVERLQRGGSTGELSLGKLLRDVGRTIGLELLKLAGYGAIMLPLFVLGLLLPGFGPALYSVVGFGLTALFWSVDYVDWPAARRELPLRARLSLVRQHIRPMLGLGVCIWALMLVPFLNLFFMPAAVAGGTLMFLDLYNSSVTPSVVPDA